LSHRAVARPDGPAPMIATLVMTSSNPVCTLDGMKAAL
jgi:hypothetical protein